MSPGSFCDAIIITRNCQRPIFLIQEEFKLSNVKNGPRVQYYFILMWFLQRRGTKLIEKKLMKMTRNILWFFLCVKISRAKTFNWKFSASKERVLFSATSGPPLHSAANRQMKTISQFNDCQLSVVVSLAAFNLTVINEQTVFCFCNPFIEILCILCEKKNESSSLSCCFLYDLWWWHFYMFASPS